jgi:hypothetical protein
MLPVPFAQSHMEYRAVASAMAAAFNSVQTTVAYVPGGWWTVGGLWLAVIWVLSRRR